LKEHINKNKLKRKNKMATKKLTNDEKIEQLLVLVNKQKEKISKIERYLPKTNMTLEIAGVRKNLNVLSDLKELCYAWSFIRRETLQFEEAAAELDIKLDNDFQGYPASDWFEDIKYRVNKIRISKERESLKSMETTLENLMSNDLKVERELDRISQILNT
jgi:hypothetical protein